MKITIPDKCEDCPFYEGFHGHFYCYLYDKSEDLEYNEFGNNKPSWCTVKELAEPDEFKALLAEATSYLREGKKKFSPNTTNSFVDSFLLKMDKFEVKE